MACFYEAEKGKIPRTETPRLELAYAKTAEDLSATSGLASVLLKHLSEMV